MSKFKTFLITLLAGLLVVNPALAAVTHIGTPAGDDTEGSNTTSNTTSVSLAAGNGRLAFYASAGNASTATEHSMTLGGNSMTVQVQSAPSPAFQMLAVGTRHIGDHGSGEGATNAVDTWTTSEKIASLAFQLAGVDSGTPVDTGSAQGAQTSLAGDGSVGPVNVTADAANVVIACYSYLGAEITGESYQSGETLLGSHYDGDGFYGVKCTMKTGEGGATDVGLTLASGTRRMRMWAVEINAAAGGGGGSNAPRAKHHKGQQLAFDIDAANDDEFRLRAIQ